MMARNAGRLCASVGFGDAEVARGVSARRVGIVGLPAGGRGARWARMDEKERVLEEARKAGFESGFDRFESGAAGGGALETA